MRKKKQLKQTRFILVNFQSGLKIGLIVRFEIRFSQHAIRRVTIFDGRERKLFKMATKMPRGAAAFLCRGDYCLIIYIFTIQHIIAFQYS